jgi:hypothetical protein
VSVAKRVALLRERNGGNRTGRDNGSVIRGTTAKNGFQVGRWRRISGPCSKSGVMAELVMFFGIGFCVAALLGLLIVLYVHNRFARLGSVDQSHADVRQLEQKLAVALEDRSKLQREIAAMKRDVEQTWAAERIESALLRERINDVAYEVVRITHALESPGSSIEPISAYATLVIGNGRRTQTSDIDSASGVATAPTMHTGPLADRIRALRTTASRAAAN